MDFILVTLDLLGTFVFALSGATMTRSAAAAMRTWGIGSPPGEAHISTRAGRLLSAAKVSGATNSQAWRVMTTWTTAPALTSRRSSSTAL